MRNQAVKPFHFMFVGGLAQWTFHHHPTKRPRLLQIPAYCFEPLKHERCIRILVLSPAMHDSDPLVARLEQRNRRTVDDVYGLQDYDAVSYVWGKVIFSHKLICNGAHLAITENVERLLRQFRRRLDDRRLWIDAICLNQSDDEEKQQQVPLMREIYEEASRVLVWLGDADTDADEIATVHKIRACALRKRQTGPYDANKRANRDFFDDTLTTFFKRPWFTRRWVLQEATAHPATTVHYGSSTISWAEIVAAASFFAYPADESPERAVLQKIGSLGEDQDLLSLLWTFHDAVCSEKRDVINALLGLGTNIAWRPDYSRDWAQEYERFARDALEAGNVEPMGQHLVFFGRLCDEVPSCASWVPNWSRPRKGTCDLQPLSRGPTLLGVFLAADVRGYFKVSKTGLENDVGARVLQSHFDHYTNEYRHEVAQTHVLGTHRDANLEQPMQGLMSMLSHSRADVPSWMQFDHRETLAYLMSYAISLRSLLGPDPHWADPQWADALLARAPWEILRQALNICFGLPECPVNHPQYSFSLLEVLFINDLIVPSILELLDKCTIFHMDRFENFQSRYAEIGPTRHPAILARCFRCPRVLGITIQQVSVGQTVKVMDDWPQ